MMKEEDRKLSSPPPPFHCKIRKWHYVFICIIHEHETLNLNKVNSE